MYGEKPEGVVFLEIEKSLSATRSRVNLSRRQFISFHWAWWKRGRRVKAYVGERYGSIKLIGLPSFTARADLRLHRNLIRAERNQTEALEFIYWAEIVGADPRPSKQKYQKHTNGEGISERRLAPVYQVPNVRCIPNNGWTVRRRRQKKKIHNFHLSSYIHTRRRCTEGFPALGRRERDNGSHPLIDHETMLNVHSSTSSLCFFKITRKPQPSTHHGKATTIFPVQCHPPWKRRRPAVPVHSYYAPDWM